MSVLVRRLAPLAAVVLVAPLLAGFPTAPARAQLTTNGSDPETQTVTEENMGPWRIETEANSAPTGGIEFGDDASVGEPSDVSDDNGTGSLRMETGAGSDAFTGKHRIVTDELEGVTLAELSLAYSTYVDQAPQSDQLAPALRVTVDYVTPDPLGDGTGAGASAGSGTLIFEPAYSGTVESGKWQPWKPTQDDATTPEANKTWWSPTPVPGTEPGVCTTLTVPDPDTVQCTWSEIEDAQGQATVRDVAIVVGDETNAGDTSVWNDFVGYVDAVKVGPNSAPTLYDFEPATVDPPLDDPAYAYALGAPGEDDSDGTNKLWRFDLHNPSSVTETGEKIWDLDDREVVVGIDFHPESGLLYALTRTPLTDESTVAEPVEGEPVMSRGRIRVIDRETLQASPLPTPDPGDVVDPDVTPPGVPDDPVPDTGELVPDPGELPDPGGVSPSSSDDGLTVLPAPTDEDDGGAETPVATPEELPASAGFPLTGENFGISFHPSGAPKEPGETQEAGTVDAPADWLLSVVTDTGEKITIDPTSGAVVARTAMRYESDLPDGSGAPGEPPDTTGVVEGPSFVGLAEHEGGLWAIDSGLGQDSELDQIVDVTDPLLATKGPDTPIGTDERAGLDTAPDGTLYAVFTGDSSTNVSRLFNLGDGGTDSDDTEVGSGIGDEIPVSDIALPPTGTLRLADPTYSVDEGGSDGTVEVTVEVTVERVGGSYGELQATLVTGREEDTATGGTSCTDTGVDYESALQTVTFAPDDKQQDITIPICDDNDGEGDESFTVELVDPNGSESPHMIGDPSSATVTITDDDPGAIEFTSDTYSVDESDVAGQVEVEITGDGGADGVTVDVTTVDGTAIAGSDYEQVTTSKAITGEQTKTVLVPISDDEEVEGDETFTVELALPGGADATLGEQSTATVTIVDDPAGTVAFDPTGYDAAEGGSVDLTISRTGGTEGEVTVGLEPQADGVDATPDASDDDYQLPASVVLSGTDADGNPSNEDETETVTLEASEDTEIEGDEILEVALAIDEDGTDGTPELGGDFTATVTILDQTLGTALAVTDSGALVSFDWQDPASASAPIPAEGLLGDGEHLVGIDYHDAADSDPLYGVTRNEEGFLKLYRLAFSESGPLTAEASPVGEQCVSLPPPVPDDVGELCVDVIEMLSLAPAVAGTQFGVDFGPAGEIEGQTGGRALHVTSDAGEHLVFDTAVGIATVRAPLTYEADAPEPPDTPETPEPPAVPPDPNDPPDPTALVPEVPQVPEPEADSVVADVVSVAHQDGSLYGLDATRDALVQQAASTTPAGDGRLQEVGNLAVSLPTNAGFDVIDLGEDHPERAFAVFKDTDANPTALHEIDLDEGAAEQVGQVGDGSLTAVDLAIRPAAAVNVSISPSSGSESDLAKDGDLEIAVTSEETGEFGVDYQITGGTDEEGAATCGEDFEVADQDGEPCTLSGSVSFESSTEQEIPLTILDDDVWEGDETLTVTLANPTTGAVLGTVSATLTIEEDSAGTIGFATEDQPIEEDTDVPASFTLTRTGGTEGEVVVRVTSSDDTAEAGEDGAGDYDAVDTAVTFPAGVENTPENVEDRTVAVPVNDDDILEGEESLDFDLAYHEGSSLPATEIDLGDSATLTINDVEPGVLYGITDEGSGNQRLVKVDQPGQPSETEIIGALDGLVGDDEIVALDFNRNDDTLYGIARESGAESAEGRVYEIPLEANTSEDVVAVEVVDGFTGLDGSFFGADFDPTSGKLRLVSDSGRNLVLTINNSSNDADDEVTATAKGWLTFADDTEGPPEVTSVAYQAADNEGSVLFGLDVGQNSLVEHLPVGDDCRCELELVAPLEGDGVTATDLAGFDTDGRGTAVAVFETASTSLYSINLADGEVDEVGVIGSDAGLPSLVGVSYAPVGSVALTGAPDAPIAESTGQATVEVERVNGSLDEVSVDLEAVGNIEGLGLVGPGGDPQSPENPTTLTFDDGDASSKTVTVTWDDDALHEDDAEVTLQLINPQDGVAIGDPGEVTFTVGDDDDPPQVSVGDVEVDEGDSGTAEAVVPVRLHDAASDPLASGKSVTVTAATAEATADATATAGDDYESTTQTITIEPGDAAGEITVPIVGDTVDEADETFEVSLDSIEGATPAATSAEVTIADDDPAPVLRVADAGTVGEGDDGATPAVFEVRLSGATERTVTVRVRTAPTGALEAVDYDAVRATLTFAPGETSRAVHVPVRGDTADEADETFELRVSAPTNATIERGAGVATIRDDDVAAEVQEVVVEPAPPRGNVTPSGDGYWIPSPVGTLVAFGDAAPVPGISGQLAVAFNPEREIVDVASDQTGEGVWLLERSGGVHALGSASFHGSIPERRAQGFPIGTADAASIAATPSGDGYAILDEDGGIHTFGDARYHGSIPQRRAEGLPIGVAETVSIAMTPSGDGYVVLEDNGGVHTFGDARYHGSIPALRLAGVPVGDAELVSIALAPGGDGYWILDEHGGVHTFGDARYHGSIPALQAAGQNIGIAGGERIEATASGEGYWIFDRAGGVFTFGDAPFRGSVPGLARE